MEDKELYKQKFQAQLDEWKADIAKLKAKADGASADVKLSINAQIEELNSKMQAASGKLAELQEAGESAWESVKEGAESAWASLKKSVSDAADKFKS